MGHPSSLSAVEQAAATLLDEHGVVVSAWRYNYTGIAFYIGNAIECPEPRGPVSFAILAHEVGHKVLHVGKNRRRPDWQVEVEAWNFALAQFDRFNLSGKSKAIERATKSLKLCFGQAVAGGVSRARIRARYPAWSAAVRTYPFEVC